MLGEKSKFISNPDVIIYGQTTLRSQRNLDVYVCMYITTVAQINRNTPPGRPVFRAVALSIFLRTYAAKVGSFERPLSCFLSRRGSPPFVWCFTCGGGSERPPISDLHYKRGGFH